MPVTHLADRGVIDVTGADATTFLQGLVTCNVQALSPGQASLGALLTPQGKIMFDFLVVAAPPDDGPRYLLDAAADRAADLAKRLGFYRLRAKVAVADVSATHAVAAGWGDAAMPALPGWVGYRDPRVGDLGWRAIGPAEAVAAAATTDAAAYRAHRVGLGVPEGGKDFSFLEAFPHEADMDQLGGVDFTKGCYVGQEVVSRMQHRGTARTRIVSARLPDDATVGADIVAGETRLGTLVAAAGPRGLALVRLDRLADALADGRSPTVNGQTIAIEKPAWATFAFPQAQ